MNPNNEFMAMAISHWYKPTGDLPNLHPKDSVNSYKVFLQFNHPYMYNWVIKDEKRYLYEKEEELKKGTYGYFIDPINDYFKAINSSLYIQNLLNEHLPQLKLKYFNYNNRSPISYHLVLRELLKIKKLKRNRTDSRIKSCE